MSENENENRHGGAEAAAGASSGGAASHAEGGAHETNAAHPGGESHAGEGAAGKNGTAAAQDPPGATDARDPSAAKSTAAAGPVDDPPRTAEAPAVESLEAKVARLEREKAELYDRVLRSAADFDNFRKRARREQEEAAGRGREQLLKEFLPVLDDLERALNALAQGGTVEALGEGVRLVDKQFHRVLEKFQVKVFDALREPFDPARHEAIQQVETDAVPPGAVAQVFARGYLVGDRLLRPAMVAVAKAKPQTAAAGGEAVSGGRSEPAA